MLKKLEAANKAFVAGLGGILAAVLPQVQDLVSDWAAAAVAVLIGGFATWRVPNITPEA